MNKCAYLCALALLAACGMGPRPLSAAELPVAANQKELDTLSPYLLELRGEDAKNVEALEAELAKLQRDGEFAKAIEPAERIAAVRSRVQGQNHWQAIDSLREVRLCRHLATRSRQERDEYAAALRSTVEADGVEKELRYRDAEVLRQRILAVSRRLLGEDNGGTATAYDNLGSCLMHQVRYADAEELFRKALEIRRQVLGENRPDTANSYQNLAGSLERQGKYVEAEPLFRKALEINCRVLGVDHANTASSYNCVGMNLGSQSKYAEAEPLLRKALEIRRRVLGEDHPDTARSYNNVAFNLDGQGKYVQAETLYRKALEIRCRVLGENHPETADSYNNLGMILKSQGHYSEAEPLLLRALDISRRVVGENHPDTASSYNNVARNLENQGKYAEAEPLFRKSLEIHREVLGDNHPVMALSYNNLAANLQAQSRYAEAELLCGRALEIRRIVGEYQSETAASYNNMANILTAQGKHAEAELLSRKSLEISRRILGDDHPETARSYHNLAGILDDQGKCAEAVTLYRKALEIWLRVLGEDHLDTARGSDNLAVILTKQREYAEAEPLTRRALEIRRRVLGEDHPDTARSYNNVAFNLDGQGKYAEAVSLYRQALEIRRRVLGEDHPDTARSYSNVALKHEEQGECAEAEPLLRKALEIRCRVLGEDHPDTATNYNELAINMLLQRNRGDAAALWDRAAASFEAARLNVAGRGLDRAVYGGASSPYPALAAVRAENRCPVSAWIAAETNLARGLADEFAARRGSRLTEEEGRRQAAISGQLGRLQPRILYLATKREPTGSEREELAKLIAERAAAEHELNELAVALSQRELAPLDDVQAAIPHDAALVLWVDVSTRNGVEMHWGCVVRSKGEPAWEPLVGTGSQQRREGNGTTSQIEQNWTENDNALPAKLRDALASGGASAAEIDSYAMALSNQRIAPLARHLQGVRKLYVVGVERMAGIPIDLLADPYTVSYVPSGTFLARLKNRTPPAGSSLLALADPIFNRNGSSPSSPKTLPPGGLLITMVAPESAAAAARLQSQDVLLIYGGVELASPEQLSEAITAHKQDKEIAITVWREGNEQPFTRTVPPGRLGVVIAKQPAPQAIAARRQADAILLSTRGGDWSELPGTRYEVAQIAGLFGGDTRTLFDSKASEQSLDELCKNGELPKYRYLHLATHGEANNVKSLQSVLILSQDALADPTLPRSGEPFLDGQLSAREVLENWKLDADLVTLSACETAVGRSGGGDGLLGFAQAFLTAGSRSVCLSLWNVDDRATALLMSRFYENLLGRRAGLDKPMPKAFALAEAKKWLRELPLAEATQRVAAITDGVERGKGRTQRPVMDGERKAELPKLTDANPFAHPRYWAAFVLIGDPG